MYSSVYLHIQIKIFRIGTIYEDVTTDVVGKIGSWQWLVTLVTTVLVVPSVFNQYEDIFLIHPPEATCIPPESHDVFNSSLCYVTNGTEVSKCHKWNLKLIWLIWLKKSVSFWTGGHIHSKFRFRIPFRTIDLWFSIYTSHTYGNFRSEKQVSVEGRSTQGVRESQERQPLSSDVLAANMYFDGNGIPTVCGHFTGINVFFLCSLSEKAFWMVESTRGRELFWSLTIWPHLPRIASWGARGAYSIPAANIWSGSGVLSYRAIYLWFLIPTKQMF